MPMKNSKRNLNAINTSNLSKIENESSEAQERVNWRRKVSEAFETRNNTATKETYPVQFSRYAMMFNGYGEYSEEQFNNVLANMQASGYDLSTIGPADVHSYVIQKSNASFHDKQVVKRTKPDFDYPQTSRDETKSELERMFFSEKQTNALFDYCVESGRNPSDVTQEELDRYIARTTSPENLGRKKY